MMRQEDLNFRDEVRDAFLEGRRVLAVVPSQDYAEWMLRSIANSNIPLTGERERFSIREGRYERGNALIKCLTPRQTRNGRGMIVDELLIHSHCWEMPEFDELARACLWPCVRK